MLKKAALIATSAVVSLSAVSVYANHNPMVSCESYLLATPYARVINQTTNQSFLVKRNLHHRKGKSYEKYIFSNGKVIEGQSRIMPGAMTCESLAEKNGAYFAYGTYSVYQKHDGYAVKVVYSNGMKQKLRVYPLTHYQFKRATH